MPWPTSKYSEYIGIHYTWIPFLVFFVIRRFVARKKKTRASIWTPQEVQHDEGDERPPIISNDHHLFSSFSYSQPPALLDDEIIIRHHSSSSSSGNWMGSPRGQQWSKSGHWIPFATPTPSSGDPRNSSSDSISFTPQLKRIHLNQTKNQIRLNGKFFNCTLHILRYHEILRIWSQPTPSSGDPGNYMEPISSLFFYYYYFLLYFSVSISFGISKCRPIGFVVSVALNWNASALASVMQLWMRPLDSANVGNKIWKWSFQADSKVHE